MPGPRTRRQVLARLAAGGSLGLAGCVAGVPDGHAEPSATPATAGDGSAGPAPSCPDGAEPFDPSWVVLGSGPLAGFELRLDRSTYARGETLVVELRNVTDSRQSTGIAGKYDVQHRGEDGWHTVFGGPADRPLAWTDEGVLHPPGGGFTWRFALTREGLSGGVAGGPDYRVCEPLRPGDYRFVYWGLTSEREREEGFETDYALGVPFGVVEAR